MFGITGRMSETFGVWECDEIKSFVRFNLLTAQLNPICHLMVLLGAHPIFHISRIRLKAGLRAIISNYNQVEVLKSDHILTLKSLN